MREDLFQDELGVTALQGYLAHKNPLPRSTLQWPYAEGPMTALGGRDVAYERGSPVSGRVPWKMSESIQRAACRCERGPLGEAALQKNLAHKKTLSTLGRPP